MEDENNPAQWAGWTAIKTPATFLDSLIIDDVCHGSAHCFAAAYRRQIRDFFASADGQPKRAFPYPRLLNRYVVRKVLDRQRPVIDPLRQHQATL
jgi:hypothetical protein